MPQVSFNQQVQIETAMGPDLSDGTIIEIDRENDVVYIQDRWHEDMIVRCELANCQKGQVFIVGENVVYPLLYNEHPTAAGIYKETIFTNPSQTFLVREKKPHRLELLLSNRKFKIWFYSICLLSGMLWEYLKGS